MGVSHSLCLLLSRQNFLDGLKELSSFLVDSSECDPESFLSNKPLRETPAKLNYLLSLKNEPYLDTTLDNLVIKHSFKKEGTAITLTFNPWLRAFWSLHNYTNHFGVIINFCDTNNLVTLPSDHPSVPVLQFVSSVFRPVFGWYDSEYTSVSDYGKYGYSKYPQPLWSSESSAYILTVMLGEPLSIIIKRTFDLDDTNNGLHYVKNLGNELYWLAWPTTIRSLEESKLRGVALPSDSRVKNHQRALQKIQAILQNIPASILN